MQTSEYLNSLNEYKQLKTRLNQKGGNTTVVNDTTNIGPGAILRDTDKFPDVTVNDTIGGGDNIVMFHMYDEAHFWSNQDIVEHPLFIHLLIEDIPLKTQAMKLHQRGQVYMKKTYESKGINNYKVFLDYKDTAKLFINDIDTKELRDLIKENKNLLLEIKKRLENGEWLGSAYPSFIDHLLLELGYLENVLTGNHYTTKEVLHFINVHNSGEVGVTAKLLDPAPENEGSLQTAQKLQKEFLKLDKEEQKMLEKLTLEKTKELNQFAEKTKQALKNKKLKSIIHPVLLDHVMREGTRIEKMAEKINIFVKHK